jgi:pyruvate dehydrogenase E2 component (dihydrolipoamide acetyltransferase)
MRQSLASTAQYTLNSSAVAAGLLSLRARLKSAGSAEDAAAVNINAMVLFCAVRALDAVPEVNVEYRDGAIHRHSDIHIGFACETPRGLLVPVIRDAGRLTLPQLGAEVKRLTAQAIDGSLAPDDFTGGTFTVSNLGIYGIESFSPILNPPQVAILGVNAIQLKPVRRDGVVEFVDYIGLSLTCDHQIIDGAPGARFLRAVGERIENIERIAVLDRPQHTE